MSSFSDCLAHKDEFLTEHLENVVDEALKTAKGTTKRIEKATVLLGLYHDIGKATRWFQKRIKGETNKKDRRSYHARLSALFANHLISKTNISDKEKTWLRYTLVAGIAKHHTNLTENPKDTMRLLRQEASDESIFNEQLNSFQFNGLESWLEKALKSREFNENIPKYDIDSIFNSIDEVCPLLDEPFEDVEDGLEFVIAWGTLLGADKIRAALPKWQPHHVTIPPETVSLFKKSIFKGKKNELDKLREEIYDQIQKILYKNSNEKFFTITAPTGSGKTLAGLASGLLLKKIKEKSGPSRLIYCLPFTSIIDQNSKVYKDVLSANDLPTGTDVLLTHHHLTDLSYRTGDEYVEDGSDLLVETWQSEIIVTTFYQLLYTLFTTKNTMLKRIPSLKNAVVILDEVQTIPHRYWDDVYNMFRHVSNILNTTFVLMTATMPLIFPRDETIELLPSHKKYFNKLNRTEILNQSNDSIDFRKLIGDLKVSIEKNPDISRIIILNRRGPVRDLYHEINEYVDNLRMLSTDLTPKDRKRIISQLKTPFTLVTTQVIEAGVDISATEVWRDIAPLDSIIQSAGRCNRHSEIELGIIRLIKVLDDRDRMMATPPYDPFLIHTTTEVLSHHKDRINESDFYQMSQQYYELVKDRSEQANVMRHFASGDLYKLADKKDGFQLISEIPHQSYFIIQNEEDNNIWEKYISLSEEHNLFEKRKKFRSMKREFMERIVNQINPEASQELIPIYPSDNRYSPITGLSPGKIGYEII